jgi:spore coat polysaccharide biosynthesis protein SpsF (cytidylyltransferase family)
MTTVAAVIQARMSSSRLPGKSVAPLAGTPLLAWVAARAARAELVDVVAVATSDDPGDDPIADIADRLGVRCVRGSLSDVLDRYRLAVEVLAPDVVVRLAADCPLVDPAIVDLGVRTLTSEHADYVSTNLAGEFPHGLDVEVARADALLTAAAEAVDPAEREHVMPFLYRQRDRFRCVAVPAPEWARHPELRLTVDQPEDLDVVQVIVARLGGGPLDVRAEDAVRVLLDDAELRARNQDVPHRTVH